MKHCITGGNITMSPAPKQNTNSLTSVTLGFTGGMIAGTASEINICTEPTTRDCLMAFCSCVGVGIFSSAAGE